MAAGRRIKIYFDVLNNTFRSANNSALGASIPTADGHVYFEELVIVCIQFCSGSVSTKLPYDQDTFISTIANDFDPATAVIIGPLLNDVTNLATDWEGDATANPANGEMTIRIDGGTAEAQTELNSDGTISPQTYLEIQGFYTPSAKPSFVVRFPFGVLNLQYQTGSPPATSLPSYYTAAQVANLFALRIGTAGQTLILVSPDGTKAREIGVGDDGILFSNLIDPYAP